MQNIGATVCGAWLRAKTFNGEQKVLRYVHIPGPWKFMTKTLMVKKLASPHP